MKLLFSLLLAIGSLSPLAAQDINLDKSSGLVQVDGRSAFYLKPTNKTFGKGNDFVLTNLDGQELAYLKYGTRQTDDWNGTTRRYNVQVFYSVTFSKSGNYCELTDLPGLSYMKIVARQIASARLVRNGQISADNEQKFVVMHGGTFLKDPNAGPAVVINTAPPIKYGTEVPKRTAEVAISGDKIYNSDELVGTFKTEEVSGTQIVTVYNASDVATVSAWRDLNRGDWQVKTNTSQITIRYHADAPLQKLFSRLVENGLFD